AFRKPLMCSSWPAGLVDGPGRFGSLRTKVGWPGSRRGPVAGRGVRRSVSLYGTARADVRPPPHRPPALPCAAPAGGNGTSSHGPKGGRPAGHHRPAENVRPAASPIHAGPTQETVPWQWLALHEQQWRLKGGRIRAAPLGPVRPHPVSSASHPDRKSVV